MSPDTILPLPLPRQWQSVLCRLRIKLDTKGLSTILDTFPPSSFNFYETIIRKQNAVRLRLGIREQEDGTKAESWAYIMRTADSERWAGELEPPVLVRDEIIGRSDSPFLSKRSTTSLLRKAQELRPPFCFMQIDPYTGATHVRDMLCALVLYYALANGLLDIAIRWDKFESSFQQALDYISNSALYQQWQHQRLAVLNTATTTAIRQREATVIDNARCTTELRTDGVPGVGIVQSAGSRAVARQDTRLAGFLDALGDRVSMLDAIPSTPVKFDLQNLNSTYFSSRMLLGTHGKHDVHVYFTQDLKGTTKILAQNDHGQLTRWKFSNLSGLQLNEPFSFFMGLDQELRSKGNKIRNLVYYYFMLAENAGVIGVPKTQATFQSMLPSFCAACRILEEAGHSVATVDVDSSLIDPGEENDTRQLLDREKSKKAMSKEQPTDIPQSLIVRLRIRPEALAAATRTVVNSRWINVADSDPDDEDEENEAGFLELYGVRSLADVAGEGVEWLGYTQSKLTAKLPFLPEGSVNLNNSHKAHHVVKPESTSAKDGAGNYMSEFSRPRPHNSGSISSYVSAAQPTMAHTDTESLGDEHVLSHTVHSVRRKGVAQTEDVNDTAGSNTQLQLCGEPSPSPVQEAQARSMRTNTERRFIILRRTSVLSVSSDDDMDTDNAVHLEQKLPGQAATSNQWQETVPRAPRIYNPDSDVTRHPAGREIEPISDLGTTSHVGRQVNKGLKNEEMHGGLHMNKEGKRSHAYIISDDEIDGNEVLEVHGGAWKRASIRRSQGKFA